MKYDKHHIDKVTKSLENGDGRVRACNAAGIDYQTFINWMEKIEFLESVKKAEDVGNNKIKDLAKRGIIEKFQTTWQAAAWWLERNYPDEYKLRQDMNLDAERKRITKLFDETISEESEPTED